MPRHQLVLQFRGDGLQDYDALIALETRLMEILEPSHTVDGHDMGSGEMNIFIFTRNPAAALAQALPEITRRRLAGDLRAAHRRVLFGQTFTVLWPPGSTESFEVK